MPKSSHHDLGQIEKKLDQLHDLIRTLWREQMSKTADLTAAVAANKAAIEALIALVQAGSTASTPDQEIQPQLDALNAATQEAVDAANPPA